MEFEKVRREVLMDFGNQLGELEWNLKKFEEVCQYFRRLREGYEDSLSWTFCCCLIALMEFRGFFSLLSYWPADYPKQPILKP